jgi:hypothetical protein
MRQSAFGTEAANIINASGGRAVNFGDNVFVE